MRISTQIFSGVYQYENDYTGTIPAKGEPYKSCKNRGSEDARVFLKGLGILRVDLCATFGTIYCRY